MNRTAKIVVPFFPLSDWQSRYYHLVGRNRIAGRDFTIEEALANGSNYPGVSMKN